MQELAPAARQGGLADLDQVPVRITDVAAQLALVLFRRREELGAAGAPVRVHRLDVRDPDVEKAAGPVQLGRGLEGDGRLVVGRGAPGVDYDPAVGQGHVGPFARADGRAARPLGVDPRERSTSATTMKWVSAIS